MANLDSSIRLLFRWVEIDPTSRWVIGLAALINAVVAAGAAMSQPVANRYMMIWGVTAFGSWVAGWAVLLHRKNDPAAYFTL